MTLKNLHATQQRKVKRAPHDCEIKQTLKEQEPVLGNSVGLFLDFGAAPGYPGGSGGQGDLLPVGMENLVGSKSCSPCADWGQ